AKMKPSDDRDVMGKWQRLMRPYIDKSIATLQMELAARCSKHELLKSADDKAGKEKGFCGDWDQYRLQ
uniref:Uncharacterized protein n=1 Tax=Aegilops tauschii subsp. strangulata TaxID=200361 RepID=A0A453SAF0_AEGTS